MSVEKIIVSVIVALFQSLAATIITFKQINNKNIKEKLKFFMMMCLYCICAFLFITNELRLITFIIINSLILYFILKIKDKTILLYSFNTEVILIICEVFISLILVVLGFDSVEIVNNLKYNLLANILISLFAILFVNIPYIKRILDKIIEIFKKKNLFNYLYIFLIILYLIVSKNGLEFVLKSNYYVNILFVIGVIIIFTIIMKNESRYEQLKDENKQMLNYVTKYEKIITEQGKANHEFKNQLMVIRGYAQMNSPKLIEYIDSVTADTNKTHSSYLISQLNKFPDGGIKGLLYYKLSIMEDEKISYEINVEVGVKTKLNSLSVDTYKNITKILGVLFDNAIDASKQSKDKKIIINVVKKTNLVTFSIYNTYKGKIDINELGNGFTTKGKGHGYGLRLVKDIIESSNIFKLENLIENEYYVTKLTIKTKNMQTKKKK